MKAYLVLSFALMTVLCSALTVNWWHSIPDEWWPVRFALVGFGISLTFSSGVMTLAAVKARYRA